MLVKALPLPAATLTAANFVLTGGVRFPPPRLSPAIVMQPGGATVERYVLTIAGNQPTDFSVYRLAIVSGAGSTVPPAFIDVRLSAVDFSFKVNCPSDFDCAPSCDDTGDPLPPDPVFDYRIRDYQGFRRQILDRLSQLVPGFREDDRSISRRFVEAAAYRADQQSYRLTGSARRRFSDGAQPHDVAAPRAARRLSARRAPARACSPASTSAARS